MLTSSRTILTTALVGIFFLSPVMDSQAQSQGTALGPRIGLSRGPDQVFIGAQAEFGPLIGAARFVPSLDFGLGDGNNVTTLNTDLRWYLLPLPETGIYFYGSAGPTIVLSPDTDLGLSLTVGANIPMKNRRRYNLEVRFGFGDVPDLKIALALMFGL